MTQPGEDKKFSVCLYLHGDRPDRAVAIIDTLLAAPGIGKTWDLLIATDAPSYDIKHLIKQEYQHAKKAVFFESQAVLGKAHWWRVLLANMRSTYALLLDDSVHPSPTWISALTQYIRDNPTTNICGFKHAGYQATRTPETEAALKDGPLLVKTSFYREYEHLEEDKTHAIEGLASYFDFSMAAELGVSPDKMSPFSLIPLFEQPSKATPGAYAPLVSVCICTYGHHPELILRCLDSIMQEPMLRSELEIILACNDTSEEVMREIDRRYRDGSISTLIRSPINFNKAGMQRFMFRIARAPYVLALDDDMYFKQGWFTSIKDQISKEHPFEVAGRLHSLSNRTLWSGQKKPYDTYCEKKSWWRGKRPYGLEVVFPAGQCFLARRNFLLDNDYPDLDMRIDWDDVLLGDMVTQLDGKQIWFSDRLMSLIVVDDIPSRGQHGGG